jgi:hypothetical protein
MCNQQRLPWGTKPNFGSIYGLQKGSNNLRIFGMKKEMNGKPLTISRVSHIQGI